MSIILIILSVTILRASEDTDQFSVDLCIPQTCRVSDTEAKLERECSGIQIKKTLHCPTKFPTAQLLSHRLLLVVLPDPSRQISP